MSNETVNHPTHYNSHPSGIECIDVIEHFSFNIGTAVKYLWRAGLKTTDAVEDLEKARWYVDRAISHAETKDILSDPETVEAINEALAEPVRNAFRVYTEPDRSAWVTVHYFEGMSVRGAAWEAALKYGYSSGHSYTLAYDRSGTLLPLNRDDYVSKWQNWHLHLYCDPEMGE
jgi:hypothetical protein